MPRRPSKQAWTPSTVPGTSSRRLTPTCRLSPDYFSVLLEEFGRDPKLGIASGGCLEEHRGVWKVLPALGDHCWGPSRVYRRSCLAAVLPLEGDLFTTLDETKAHMAGYSTKTVRGLPFRHHRPEAANDVSVWKHWHRQGVGSYQLGYRPTYLLARCGYRATRHVSALGLIFGYTSAFLHRTPRYHDTRVVEAIRDQQRARQFLSVVRGTSGDGI